MLVHNKVGLILTVHMHNYNFVNVFSLKNVGIMNNFICPNFQVRQASENLH